VQTFLYALRGLIFICLLPSLVLTYPVQEHPRKPYRDAPERSERLAAEDARQSESSRDPGYAVAVRGFIDRQLTALEACHEAP
jgi:hypothetical protein